MASNLIRRVLGGGNPPNTHSDVENGPQSGVSPADSHMVEVDHDGHPQIAPDDQLNLFRYLTGITTHPSMVHLHASHGGRAAPNLGIYSRVVHNEQDAKKQAKYYSLLINGCLGIQIVVAAALTALGAAGANHSSVTAFGAINTVIAGILTFLKGSGQPSRLKYYYAEWKRIREFIEQRERDFGRPGCDLEVYGMVAVVEKMYDDVKADLEASVPERFAGYNSKKGGGHAEPGTTQGVTTSLPQIWGGGGPAGKLKELESGFGNKFKDLEAGLDKVNDLASRIGHRTNATQAAARDLQTQAKGINADASRPQQYDVETSEHTAGNLPGNTTGIAKHGAGHLQQYALRIGEHVAGHLGLHTPDIGHHATSDAQQPLTGQLQQQATEIAHQAEHLEQHATETSDHAAGGLQQHATGLSQRASRDLQEQTRVVSANTADELVGHAARAEQAESSFAEKLKDLSVEIGNKTHLAQAAVNFLEAHAKHNDTRYKESAKGARGETEHKV